MGNSKDVFLMICESGSCISWGNNAHLEKGMERQHMMYKYLETDLNLVMLVLYKQCLRNYS